MKQTEIFAQRLNEAMENAKAKQTDLCKDTGISKSTMSQYLNGKYVPNPDRLKQIAHKLDVNPAWLAGFDDQNPLKEIDIDEAVKRGMIKQIPILGETEPAYTEHPEIDFAVTVRDNSMLGVMAAGSIAFISKTAEIANGDYVMVSVNGIEIIRRYYKYGKKIILRPEHPQMKETEHEAKDVKILGKVKMVNSIL